MNLYILGVFDEENKIKMSSAGLIYKYYGKEAIVGCMEQLKINFDHSEIDLIYNRLYKNFIMMVDARDNGINQYDIQDVKAKYSDNTTFQDRIGRCNPLWTDSAPKASEQFKLAMAIAEDELIEQLKGITLAWLPAYSIVRQAVVDREKFHSSGEVLLLEKSCPWKEHLYNLENELQIQGKIKFVLYKDGDGGYRVQTVGIMLGSFDFRIGLKTEWRGIRDQELAKVSGIEDISFVHNNGFIGGAKSLEGAIKLVNASLN